MWRERKRNSESVAIVANLVSSGVRKRCKKESMTKRFKAESESDKGMEGG
jgi:hypothetical protein